MSYVIVNEELRVQSCSIEDLNQETKDLFVKQFNGDKVETLTLFYNLELDIIFLNNDHKDYDTYELIATTYLVVDDDKRKLMKEEGKDFFNETFNILDIVVRRREQLERDKEAIGLRKILANQVMEIYRSNLDMLRALRRVDEQHNNDGFFNDYNPFVYGYIQGIRAERNRRKRVSL